MESGVAGNNIEPKRRRGALIVVEGLDRAGKSTQCAMLMDMLEGQGYMAEYIRFPDRTTAIGKIIDSYLRGETHLDDHAIHLLFSANRWELASRIRDYISKGITVVIDRYSYSGAVYSAAKNNENLSLQWAWQPEIGLPRPDIWFFLNISPEKARERGGYGLERYENVSLQLRVGELFKSLKAMEDNSEMCIVDAGQSKEKVAEEMSAKVLTTIKNTSEPLGNLGPWSFAQQVRR